MLKGKTVGLRAIEESDLPQLLAWRNQPEYRQYFREFHELSSTNQHGWYESRVLHDPNTIMFAIVRLADSKLLGACGLCYIDWVNRHADFSIYIGEGGIYIDDTYAIEAARLMMDYGRDELGLHRYWSEIYDIDEKKKVLFDRLGFQLEGRQKESHWTHGGWHDSLYYGFVNAN